MSGSTPLKPRISPARVVPYRPRELSNETTPTSLANSYNENQAVIETETDYIFIERDIRRFFDRAIAITIAQSGAAAPNFALSGNGAVVLLSDLRAHDLFDPLTAAAPGNRSQVRNMCCGRSPNMAVNVPLGPRVNITSQCTSTNGLSIEVVRGGVVNRAQGYPTISELSVATTGFNEITQSTIYFWDIAAPSGLKMGGNRAITELRSRLQLYVAPGFSGAQESVTGEYPAVSGN